MADIDNYYRPRLSTELRPDQFERLKQILPHGVQKPLFEAIVDGIITLYDKGGYPAIGAIISGHISVTQLAQSGKPLTYASHLENGH
jgi:hypothetical protein